MGERAIPRLLEAEAIEGCRLRLRYDDGASGEVDLSALVGEGVFAAWSDPAFFASARLASDGGAGVWGDDARVDACPDARYMRLTGKTPEELMPAAFESLAHA